MSPEMLEPPFEEEEVYARADKVDSYALAIVLWDVWDGGSLVWDRSSIT